MDISKILEKIANIYGFQIIFFDRVEATHGPFLIHIKTVSGVTDFHRNLVTIYQNPKVPKDPSRVAVVLAHELGHVTDYLLYERLMDGENQDWQKAINIELVAWAKGKRFLQKLGFTDWEKFDELRKEGLATYGYHGP